jgi:acetyl esterase/lipase
MIFKKFVLLSVCMFFSIMQFGQTVVSLYAGKAPGSEKWNWAEKEIQAAPGNKMIYNVVVPELLVYPAPAEKATGTSIIVAPGGAFHILSIDNEGINVAKWLNELGITAFVLKYRLVKSVTDNPFTELMPLMSDFKKLDEINDTVVVMAKNDGIEAMKYVRNYAKQLNLDPGKIGFMGFSAGGTVTMSVMLSAPQPYKPDFVAPIYLYNNAVLGNEMPNKVTPIFVAVASDDQLKFVPHSIKVYQDWMNAKHPAELHIYENGGHGFGIKKNNTASDQWSEDFKHWLKGRKLIK